jgi:hypothetical protein
MLINILNPIYDWVVAIINNPNDLSNPNLSIIPSHKDIPAPDSLDPYITINYTLALETLGKADWKVEDEGGTIYKTLRTDYEGTIEFREIRGNGSYLYKLVNSQWIPEANDYLRENNISFLRNNDIVPIPKLLDETKWQEESVLEIVFGFGAGVRYETNTIEDIEATGTLTEEDGTERIVYVTKDSP